MVRLTVSRPRLLLAATTGAALLILGLAALALPDQRARADTLAPRYHLPHVASRGFTTGLASAALGGTGRAAVRNAGGADEVALRAKARTAGGADEAAVRTTARIAGVSNASSPPADGPDGIVGWGESRIELQSKAASDLRLEIELGSFLLDPVSFGRLLPAGDAHTVPLKHVIGVTAATYAAVVSSEGPVGVIARTTWEGGGATAYMAPELGDELVLPLAMRDVYTHSSLIHIANTEEVFDNRVLMRSYMSNGAVRNEWELTLWPGETGRLDPSYEAEFADLSMEALWFTADAPLAIMALGDEYSGRGVSSLRARPPSAGNARQWLPFVRANAGGDSLIAVANAHAEPVEARITYRGSDASPSGAGQVFEQQVRIGSRSAIFVDLDERKRRGNTEPPARLPRGTRDGEGFYGSVEIVGDGPLLAAAWEQSTTGYITNVMTSAAYNAFGPDDLSAAYAVPHVTFAPSGPTTQLVLLNPGSEPVGVNVDVVDTSGETRGLPAANLGPGEMAVVPLVLRSQGWGRALIDASAPIAVLVYDFGVSMDAAAYWAVQMPPELVDLPTRTPTATPLPATETPTPGLGTPSATPGQPPEVASTISLPVACNRCR